MGKQGIVFSGKHKYISKDQKAWYPGNIWATLRQMEHFVHLLLVLYQIISGQFYIYFYCYGMIEEVKDSGFYSIFAFSISANETTASNDKVLSAGIHFAYNNYGNDLDHLVLFGPGRITGIEIGRFLRELF